ncbi:hypothetical protein BU26DRAFT_590119 [Trematosphaeria pertusa]|uniref:Myb-like domain-containing protein n=1 Tax=Trematosphaeria pertusa TaxID=390896 RepID=A0A6A6IMY7_9PLEO|nr:uncharacterized protein BU26DRAFT_590119 [Trematosphaeria pertusa]KAF2251811.1 hypothetical protein BU26DRAFT_590119 [Trematosphaeria pertusa]
MSTTRGRSMDSRASAARAVQSFLPDEELRPHAPLNLRWRAGNPLFAHYITLIERVRCLNPTRRLQLAHGLTFKLGWPSHLRSIEQIRAGVKPEPGSRWSPEDKRLLLLFRVEFEIPNKFVAAVFFEGRTADECESQFTRLLQEMNRADKARVKEGKDFLWSEEQMVKVAQTKQQGKGWEDIAEMFSGRDPTQCKYAYYRYLYRRRELPERTVEATPSEASTAKQLPEAVIRIKEQTPPSQPQTTDDLKRWDQEDRDLVFNASQSGMSSKEIWQKHFSSRTFGAVRTRVSFEKKLRGAKSKASKWSDGERNLLLRLVNGGHGFEQIAPKWFPHRTAENCEAYYKYLMKAKGPTLASTEASGGEVDAEGDVDMQSDMDIEADMTAADNDDDEDFSPEDHSEPASPPHTTQRTARRRRSSATNANPYSAAPNADDEAFLESQRSSLIASIDVEELSAGEKTKLKKALDEAGWPKRFTSIADYHAPPPKTGKYWPLEDSRALVAMRETSDLSFRIIADKFYPGRSEKAVRNHYGTLERGGRESDMRRGRATHTRMFRPV